MAFLSAILFCLVGWTVVQLLPPRYEVTAKLYFDPRTLLQPLLKGLAVDNVFQLQSASVERLISQRKNLEQIAKKGFFNVEGLSPIAFEQVLTALASRIRVSQEGENVFKISYQDQDPKRASNVVQELLTLFMNEARGENRADALQSRQFLDEQIMKYQTKLEQAEARLGGFKEKNFALLSSQDDYLTRLNNVNEQIDNVTLQSREVESRRDQIMKQLKRARTIGAVSQTDFPAHPNTLQDPDDVRINRLQERLDELLTKYTVHHPEVVYTQRTLDELLERKLIGSQEDLGIPINNEREPIGNPVYRELKMSLAAVDAEMAAIYARLQEYQRRQKELKARLSSSLKIEAEFKRLSRSYNTDKSQFEEFVKRRELLDVTDKAVQDDDLDLQIRILEPPFEPLIPVFPPNKKILNLIVLLGGLAGGVGLSLLVAMLRPVVYGKEELSDIKELPILGAVSMVSTPMQSWLDRFHHVAFLAGWLALVFVGYGVIVRDWFNHESLLRFFSVAM